LYTNAGAPNPPQLDYTFAAGRRFMNPDGSDANPAGPVNDPGWENHWHRVLEFLEVRPRAMDSLAGRLQLNRRTYGRMNINTIRHPHVLAGLIDDPYHLNVANSADPTQDLIDGTRDWYDELLTSRDGIDHLTGLPLPGMPQSRPFRGLSYINPINPDESAEDTILRTTPSSLSTPELEFYGLFEARSANDISALGGTDEVDYYTRNRILGKVQNLTTNRSHVFVAWIGIQYFEAHQIPVMLDTDGDGNPDTESVATQIGGKAEDLRMRRMFCVIDRSRLEEAYYQLDPNDPASGRFDFRQFIIHKEWID
jgi:hypothetical protein